MEPASPPAPPPEAPPPSTPAPPTAAPAAKPGELPPMCLACGQMLGPQDEKCPSCGAAVRHAKPARRGRRLTTAGSVFLILFAFITFQGGQLVYTAMQGDFGTPGDGLASTTATISGTVNLPDDVAAPGVLVRVTSGGANNTTTDANGTYTLRSVPAGYHLLRFELEGHKTVEMRMLLFKDETINVKLEAGNGTVAQDHVSYAAVLRFLNICGGVLVAIGLLLLAGSIACYRRRSYRLALSAAIGGVVVAVPMLLLVFIGGLLYLPVVILSIVAIVLVVKGKAEFA